jgi:hypothetical protein
MRDTTPARWMQWRVKLVDQAIPAEPAFVRQPHGAGAEEPGPNGIRHGLVARIRREISAGTYDTEDRWLAAEEVLLSRIAAGA